MQVNNDKTEIRVNIQNLFLRGGVVIAIEDLVDIFQYSINQGLVQAVKRKGVTTISKKEVKK